MAIQRKALQFCRSIPSILAIVCVGLIISSCVWTTTISVGRSGEPGNYGSSEPAISGNGRYVAFASAASNLVQGGTIAGHDVFLRDTFSGTTSLVSVSSDGTAANSFSQSPAISDDGRYIVYGSAANNLVADDINNAWDVFLYDRNTAITTRMSVDSNGIEGNAASNFPQISADGRYIAYSSSASNLVTGDANGLNDVFVRDRTTATTTRVNVSAQGDEADGYSALASLSDDGRYIVFDSFADNLVVQGSPFQRDIFVHDQTTGTTTLVSVDTEGNMGFEVSADTASIASISGNGRFVSFSSRKRFFVMNTWVYQYDLFVHDRNASTTSMISVPGHQHTGGVSPSLSVDGRYVAFHSASSLEAGDTNNYSDVYVHDRNTGATPRVSLTSSGTQTDRSSQDAKFSTDGRYVAFQTVPFFTDPGNLDVVIRAFPALTVASIVPSTLQVGATTPVTITGTNFMPGSLPRVAGGELGDPVIVDENTITVNVTVPAGTPIGSKDVTVDLPGTGPGLHAGAAGRCIDCVTLLPPGGC